MKKIITITISILIFTIILSILFIKLNTTAAANFTDNILRPVLGANNVIFLEKIFFNTSDKIQQATSNDKNIFAPNFNDGSNTSNLRISHLDMNPISSNHPFTPLKNEGLWKIMKINAFPKDAVIAYTFIRPDSARSYAIVTLAQIDTSKINLGIVAGTKEPGGKAGNPGPGVVPQDIVAHNLLVAAFDGGFQYRDGQYGMVVDNKIYLPLQENLGTIVGYKNGNIKIVNYTGQDLGSDITFIRQNCPILIENGQMAVEDIKNKKLWGRTLTSSIYTWRTGLALTKNGNLLFAVGNNLTPSTLARALKMAGAENAIQLDINPNWVRFNLFNSIGDGKYISHPLTRDLKDGSSAYLNGYSKDFFYIYKK